MKKQKVIFILGPTGVGKTNLSVWLAKEFNGEIISADSVQIFKEFDIGSAKVTKEEMSGVQHYGIDIVKPNQEFSVFDYISYTKECINEISKKGKLPIIVGGTGLYVKALTEGYNLGGTEKHEEFRQNIEKEIETNGLESVYKILKERNPLLAEKTDRNNKVRVIRALEIATFGGEKQKDNCCQYDFQIFALNIDRQILYQRINQRVDKMIDSGLESEANNLLKKYGKNAQPMKAIGYKEFIDYFDNLITKEEAIEFIKQHSRNYAKRQLTFLRSMKNVDFIDVLDFEKAKLVIKEKIGKFL